MVTAAMPQDVPECGRIGCTFGVKHKHDDWVPGDRVVIEPKLATAPGYAYSYPRGVVTAPRHLKITAEVVTVELDAGGGTVEVDWHLLTREATYNRREQRLRATGRSRKRKHALDPDVCDELTLDDYLLGNT